MISMKRGLFQHMQQQQQPTMFAIIFVFLAAILTDSLTAGQQVYVQPNTALLNEGERTDLLCNFGRKIDYCRIEVPGEPKALNLSPKYNKNPGFTYFGSSLEAGQCGVSIERVKAINNGQVKCTLGAEGEEYEGRIDLVVTVRPLQPSIQLATKPDHDGYYKEGDTFQARCIIRDGRPAANITWFLDNMPVEKSVSQMEIVESPHGPNSTLLTSVQDITWQLGPEDNNRKLICRSYHQTDRDSLPPQEAAIQLSVRYPPVRQTEALVYGLYLDRTAIVNMTIQANPPPTVEWNIDGNIILQGRQDDRFSAFEPEYLGHDFYNVTLAIAGLTLEDTTKTYLMRASNALGSTDYKVRISSSSTPPTAGLDIGAIIGIIVAVAVLVLVILLIVFARATGRWCFGGKSVKTATNETSDTESAEVKATSTMTIATTTANEGDTAEDEIAAENVKKSKRHLPSLSAMFKRLNERDARKKKYVAETNAQEVEGNATAAEADQQNGERTDGNDNEAKEDKQLVYAELVLKPSDVNEAPAPPQPRNSTEYAEIVYVQKPQAEQQQQQQQQVQQKN